MLLAAALGCVDREPFDPIEPPIEPPIDPPVDPPPVVTCPVSGTAPSRSLAITEPAALARFGFGRVLDRLRSTGGTAGTQTSLALYQAWLRTFGASPAAGDCDDASIDPEGYGLRCPRGPELALASVDPLGPGAPVRFVPVGLFNRFDLAPADGRHCGEYRIVFALASEPGARIGGRGFVIFEAALPNPTPAAGADACLPVARFWQALSAELDPAVRAARLEQFYFTGDAVPGFPAVVDARHYGLAAGAAASFGAGQIRTNLFVDDIEWDLREFKLRRRCGDPATCQLAVEQVTVKANPAEALFAGTHAGAAAFTTAFVAQLPGLVGADPATLALDVPDVANTFESVSTPGTANVRYATRASVTLRAELQRGLLTLAAPLTTSQVLARATTQTCAGCHELSSRVDLGAGVAWPASNGFTHVDERGQLSPALTEVFLPHRRAVLERFINARCDAARRAPDDVDATRTLGGGVVGAAN
ncbi:MAG: hypothetical protein IPL61_36740 [Myxococcales bacterium]|nr:hypothetical protein [Myxococcales bacterium]